MPTVKEAMEELESVQQIIDRMNTMADDEPLTPDDTNKILIILNGYCDRILSASTYAPISA